MKGFMKVRDGPDPLGSWVLHKIIDEIKRTYVELEDQEFVNKIWSWLPMPDDAPVDDLRYDIIGCIDTEKYKFVTPK